MGLIPPGGRTRSTRVPVHRSFSIVTRHGKGECGSGGSPAAGHVRVMSRSPEAATPTPWRAPSPRTSTPPSVIANCPLKLRESACAIPPPDVTLCCFGHDPRAAGRNGGGDDPPGTRRLSLSPDEFWTAVAILGRALGSARGRAVESPASCGGFPGNARNTVKIPSRPKATDQLRRSRINDRMTG